MCSAVSTMTMRWQILGQAQHVRGVQLPAGPEPLDATKHRAAREAAACARRTISADSV